MNAFCIGCGDDLGFNAEDGIDITCGTCVQVRCGIVSNEASLRLSAVDVADVQAKRSELGWSQEDLALHLAIPKSHVSGFERGLRLCPQEVADWIS